MKTGTHAKKEVSKVNPLNYSINLMQATKIHVKRSVLIWLLMAFIIFVWVYGLEHASFSQELQTSLWILSIFFFLFYFFWLYWGWKVKKDHTLHHKDNSSLREYIKRRTSEWRKMNKDNNADSNLWTRNNSDNKDTEWSWIDTPDIGHIEASGTWGESILSGVAEFWWCDELAWIIFWILFFIWALWLFWSFLWILWLWVLIFYAILYWISYWWMKKILKNSNHHQWNLWKSIISALFYTFLTTGRIYLLCLYYTWDILLYLWS